MFMIRNGRPQLVHKPTLNFYRMASPLKLKSQEKKKQSWCLDIFVVVFLVRLSVVLSSQQSPRGIRRERASPRSVIDCPLRTYIEVRVLKIVCFEFRIIFFLLCEWSSCVYFGLLDVNFLVSWFVCINFLKLQKT